jgi:hypothetical protein
MKIFLSIKLCLALVAIIPVLVQAQVLDGPNTSIEVPSTTKPGVDLWPDRVWTDLSREVDRSGTQLTNILFDQIDKFELYSVSQNNNSAALGVKRSVYDNQDVLNSYTVNDQFLIELGRNATEYSIPLVPALASPVNFNLGINGRLQVTHIRQVSSSRFPKLPTVADLQKELEEESRVLENEKRKWWEMDPSWRPRLIKFWNPLISVWRIPWTKEGLKKIQVGDLISYSTSGHVSVGIEAGFLPVRLTPGIDLSVGAGVQAYVRGEFRITLLKESERYVKVKLTRVRSYGKAMTVGSTTNDMKVMEGFFLFEGKKLEKEIKDQKITVIPFKLTVDHENKNQSDIGYRFDLDDPEGEIAFEKAMRGNFHYAHEISEKSDKVTHILTREAFEKRRSSGYTLGLKWLYNFGKSREKKDLWAVIEKPDGEKEIFKSSLQMARSWTTLWGTGEKQNFLFTTILDESAWLKKEENSFQLISEALYEDVTTTGREMHKYVRDVQSVIGNRQIIPELPLLVPKEGSNRLKRAKYRRSSFYFGQYFSQKQVEKFIMTDSKKAWEISCRSFDYVTDPLKKSSKINAFFRHWMDVQEKYKTANSLETLIDALQNLRLLFKFHGRAIHAMRALIVSLDGEDIDYFVTATNNAFGRIQFRGRQTTNAERLLQLADETVDFENKVGMYRPDLNAKIEDFKVEQLPNKHLKISFTMPKFMPYFFFKLIRSSGWKKVKTLKDFIYVNKGRFKEGKNEFIVRPASEGNLESALWEGLRTSDYYTLQVAGSIEQPSWGRVVSARFKFEPIEIPEIKP